MEKLFAQYPIAAWIVLAGMLVTAIGVLWRKAVRPAWRRARSFFRAIAKFIDDWFGEPATDGRPATRGVVDQLKDFDKRLLAIEHELRPNSGASLRDAVDRVEVAVTPDETSSP